MIVVAIASIATKPSMADEPLIDRLFDPKRVTEISIELAVKDWNELCKQSRDPGKVFSGSSDNPFTNFKGNITVDGVEIGSVGIRKKGFLGSLDDKFPSLKIKFNEYEKQDPIPGLDGLTLNNNKQDSSLISQYLAYKLFNEAGVQAPRCAFARVTVNGKYLGLYSNVESIGKPFLERRFGNSAGNLYEGTLADFYPKAIERLDAKTNKKNHDRSKITRLATLLASKEDLPLDEIEQLLDVENFLRFWGLESLIGFWDGYSNNQNNFWVYDNRANDKFYFMPWGADGAFMGQGAFPGFGSRGPVSVYAEGMLANRLYRDAKSVERYRDTMRWLLANVWKEDELLKSVDEMETVVSKHLHARQSGAPRAMNSVRNFIRTRRQAVEKELDGGPVRVASQPRKPMYTVQVGSARGRFSTQWADNAPSNIVKAGSAKLDLELEGKHVDFQEIGASAHRQKRGGFGFGFGGPNGPPPEMANIVIRGLRDGDGKPLTITLNVDPQTLKQSAGQTLDVQGTFAGGDEAGGRPFFMPVSRRTVTGTLALAKSGTKPQDPVEGEFDFTITEMRGGFMDQRPGGPGGGPPPGPMFGMNGPGGIPWSPVALVALREVQDELSITDEQRMALQENRRQLDETSRANGPKMQEAFQLPEEERMERFQALGQKMEEANRNANSKIDTILDAKQRDRLKQLQIQREGAAVLGRPDIVEELKLNEDQQDRLRSVRDAQPGGPFAFGQTDEQRRQLVQDSLAILTDEQKEKWQTMAGKEFRFPNPPAVPGPPGGPVPGGR